jgi:hypothetical protein
MQERYGDDIDGQEEVPMPFPQLYILQSSS